MGRQLFTRSYQKLQWFLILNFCFTNMREIRVLNYLIFWSSWSFCNQGLLISLCMCVYTHIPSPRWQWLKVWNLLHYQSLRPQVSNKSKLPLLSNTPLWLQTHSRYTTLFPPQQMQLTRSNKKVGVNLVQKWSHIYNRSGTTNCTEQPVQEEEWRKTSI